MTRPQLINNADYREDEVHHLHAKTRGEAALMAPAPFRLGLTATYPEEHEQLGERWRLEELIGPIVFTQKLETLVGKQLAEYRTQRVRVDLTPPERATTCRIFISEMIAKLSAILLLKSKQRT
jgi:superfamily II DNA or RNA helicase